MGAVIELSSLHAFLCTRDKQRAKQFKRMRRANLRARKSYTHRTTKNAPAVLEHRPER